MLLDKPWCARLPTSPADAEDITVCCTRTNCSPSMQAPTATVELKQI